MPHEEIWKSFEQNPLTHSAAHYLMTIKELITENGYARLTDIARHLSITSGSYSLSLKVLKKRDGLLQMKTNLINSQTKDSNLQNLLKEMVNSFMIFSTKNLVFPSGRQR